MKLVLGYMPNLLNVGQQKKNNKLFTSYTILCKIHLIAGVFTAHVLLRFYIVVTELGTRTLEINIIYGVDVDRNSNYRNPTYSNMGCNSRNKSVDLFF